MCEADPSVPRGYTLGALVTRSGRNWVYVTRDDGATILAELSPSLIECVEGDELELQLAIAFDALTPRDPNRSRSSSSRLDGRETED